MVGSWLAMSPFRVDPYIARSFQVLVECIIDFLRRKRLPESCVAKPV